MNRQFFHPLGLALEVEIDNDGNEKLGGVWDYRDDPEGMAFADNTIDDDKINRVGELWREKEVVRKRELGWMVQPK